jgi:hypothetical protein
MENATSPLQRMCVNKNTHTHKTVFLLELFFEIRRKQRVIHVICIHNIRIFNTIVIRFHFTYVRNIHSIWKQRWRRWHRIFSNGTHSPAAVFSVAFVFTYIAVSIAYTGRYMGCAYYGRNCKIVYTAWHAC